MGGNPSSSALCSGVSEFAGSKVVVVVGNGGLNSKSIVSTLI